MKIITQIPIDKFTEYGLKRDYVPVNCIKIKKANYQDYRNAYIKALFYENKSWIKYLEKNHIKDVEVKMFKKLVSEKGYKQRENYFLGKKSRLNVHIRNFIDKYGRFKTYSELYK